MSKKNIFLFALLLSALCTMAQKRDTLLVTGKVKDAATGASLRGIRVTYKDFSAAITDSAGRFSLKVPSSSVAITLEGEGYQRKELALKSTAPVTIGLYEDTYTSFYDDATLPLGSAVKNKIPYAATSVQTGGAWGKIAETPSTYLQGRVAGLNAIRRSGTPNIGASLTLRGMSSLYASNQPLIIVDGVIFDNRDNGGSIISNHYTDPLSTIDVRDIDNITVLKDGSSTYGTKGANGVIIITTARARELGTKIDFAVYGGINFTPSNIPVLDATQYRSYLSDILQSQGLTSQQIAALPYMNDNPSNPDYYRYHNNTDWQKEVFNRSYSQNMYLKVTGGDNIARYALSLGYMKSGSVTNNTDLGRYNMRFNGDLNLSNRLTAVTNLSFAFNEQNLRDQGTSPKTNPIFLALTKSPLLRVREVSGSGVESPVLADRDTFNMSNPVTLTDLALGINKQYRFLGSIGFNYQLSKAFSLSTTVGITNDKVRESFFIPRKGVTTDTLNNDIAFSRIGTHVKSLFSIFNDSRLGYNRTFNNIHQLSSRLGVRYLYNKVEQDFGFGYNSAIDELVSVGNGVNALRRVGGFSGESNWLNTYFSTDYSYADKLFFSFNVAMDGSSRFGKNIEDAFSLNGNKYAVLPSIAGAWLISSEGSMQSNVVDLFKLRASYGLTGNDDIGNYTARQTYVSQNLLGLQGLVRGSIGNNRLQWERVRKLNIGIDAAFFNERVNISVDAYHNRTTKMILYAPVPVASAFDFAITNSGALRSSGIEASVTARIVNRGGFKWDAGFTLAHYQSTIERLPADVVTNFGGAAYLTQQGHTPNVFYGYATTGVYASDAEAAAAGLSVRRANGALAAFRGGDVRFTDLNGDRVIDESDRSIIGNPNPDVFGSITNRFEYGRFALDALFTFVEGVDVYNGTRAQLESVSGYANQTGAVVNRWRTNGQQTTIPKASWGDPMGNSRFSDRWIEDGSYLRLRTATVSYQLPLRGKFVKYSTAYVTGNNIFTLTKYKGYDPEFSATESPFGQGVDNTLEPQFRSVQLGLRIGL